MSKSARIAAQIDAFEAEMITTLNRKYPDLDARRGDWVHYLNDDFTLWKYDALCAEQEKAVNEEQAR
jgi:hypothetical protein